MTNNLLRRLSTCVNRKAGLCVLMGTSMMPLNNAQAKGALSITYSLPIDGGKATYGLGVCDRSSQFKEIVSSNEELIPPEIGEVYGEQRVTHTTDYTYDGYGSLCVEWSGEFGRKPRLEDFAVSASGYGEEGYGGGLTFGPGIPGFKAHVGYENLNVELGPEGWGLNVRGIIGDVLTSRGDEEITTTQSVRYCLEGFVWDGNNCVLD